MKKHLIYIAGLLTAISSIQVAQAAEPYVGLQVGQMTTQYDGGSKAVGVAVIGEIGTEFNENIALVLRVGFSPKKKTKGGLFAGLNTKSSIDFMVSYLTKASLPINIGETFNLYTLMGATTAKVTASTPAASVSNTKTQASYGAGLEYYISKNARLGVEYMVYGNKAGLSTVKMNSVSASIDYSW